MRSRLRLPGDNRLLVAFVLVAWLLACVPAATAANRVALVIGNADYRHLPALANPVEDANAVANRLGQLGFQLLRRGSGSSGAVINLDENGFVVAIEALAEHARGAEIALLYFAGHGMQVAGESYLLPVDVPVESQELLRRNSLRLEEILAALDGKAALTVAIFDACRDVPIKTRSTRGLFGGAVRGLGRIDSGGRSRIVAYSGAPGEAVADGGGRHSPYTQLLLDHLGRKRTEVGTLFQTVSYEFGQRHGGQNPEVLVQGVAPDRFFLPSLHGGDGLAIDGLAIQEQPGDSATTAPGSATAPRVDRSELDLAFWNSIKESGRADDYRAYLTQFPDGHFATLARLRLRPPPEPEPEQRPNRAPPSSSRSLPSPNDVRVVVQGLLDANNRRNVDDILFYYAEDVDFFGAGVVGQGFIRKDKRDYFKRWSQVRSRVMGDLDIRFEGAEAVAHFKTAFEVYSDSRGHGISGEASNTWRMREIGGRLRVVSNKQTVLSRHRW